MPETMNVQERIYDLTMQITELVDFGLAMDAVMSGKSPIPPEGLRVNAVFQGALEGPKLVGKIEGTDYALLKPDGNGALDVHAVITTSDGEHISLRADGVLKQEPNSPAGQLRENVTLQTASSKYSWVNGLQCWGTGSSDLSTGKIKLTVFAA